MISEIVNKVPIKHTDRFIDLGSGWLHVKYVDVIYSSRKIKNILLTPFTNFIPGVGQVVLQVSGEARCIDSWGIEKQDIPCSYAKVRQWNNNHEKIYLKELFVLIDVEFIIFYLF